ncbi:DUF4129 domain-containing protein [Caenimonas sp. SL110]|uniref:DUF4129 domain-containing protein n=1 Tax=Caenimonas sp. SL110 TaxID=1450524 RepID=UPI001EE6C1B4|nr:DUF4129 domain-containing protein [Caenimonas sp. SL110]
MPTETSMRPALLHIALCIALALVLAFAPLLSSRAAPGDAPPQAEVEAAAAQVAKDPNLPARVTEKKLRFRDDEKPEKPKDGANDSLTWLVDLLRWMSEAGRLLVWLAGAVAVAMLLVGIRRWVKARADAAMPARAAIPSHVQSLDIRPESLPRDVGVAAEALWRQGEHRAALSLLYRGALSRLVHDHEVPIRAATTEGECVTLANASLDADAGEFVTRLVRAWQLAVYGQRMPTDQDALALCHEFDEHLSATSGVAAA